MLAEEAARIQSGFFADRVLFQDDEYVTLQSPWSRTAGYLRKHWKEYDKIMVLPKDDPKRLEWIDDDQIAEHIHCIVDWCIYKPDGTKYPVPTDEDMSSWWEIMEDERALIIGILQEHYYKPRDEEMKRRIAEVMQEGAASGDDPKTPTSGNGSDSPRQSRPPSKVSVLTH